MPHPRSHTSISHLLRLSKHIDPHHHLHHSYPPKHAHRLLRASQNVPVAYILGNIPFADDLLIRCRKPVLIPRPETEEWVVRIALALSKEMGKVSERVRKLNSGETSGQEEVKAQTKYNILECGTGSGCIAIHLAKTIPNTKITTIDVSGKAIWLAQKNAELNNVTERIDIRKCDLFDEGFVAQIRGPEHKTFDMIVSNPPYISKAEYKTLASSVRCMEDVKALVGNASSHDTRCRTKMGKGESDGNQFYHRLIRVSGELLRRDSALSEQLPHLVMELGYNTCITELLCTAREEIGLHWARVSTDFAGHNRCIEIRFTFNKSLKTLES